MGSYFSIFAIICALITPEPAAAGAQTCPSNLETYVKIIPEPISKMDELTAEYKTGPKIPISRNQGYINLIEKDDGKDFIHITFSLGNLKELNDHIIGSKPAVDAISNFGKSNFLRLVQEDPYLRERLGNITEGDVFSDAVDHDEMYMGYKNINFAFRRGANPGELQKRLIALAQQNADEFQAKIESLGISHLYENQKGISASPLTWHRVGIGNTAAEAGLWARAADEENFKPGKLHVGTETTEAPKIKAALSRIDSLEETMASNPSLLKQGFLVATKTGGRARLSLQTMYLLKNFDKNEFASVADKVFQINLTPKEVDATYEWFDSVDRYFGPDIYTSERVSVHGIQSKYGFIAVDYRNLSGRKIATAMEGIAASPKQDIQSVLKKTKTFFDTDHERLLAQHGKIQAAANKPFIGVPIYHSGDEVGITVDEMQLRKMRAFVMRVQRNPETNQIRTVFTTIEDIKTRGEAIHQAEDVEKTLRRSLQGKVDRVRLENANFAIAVAKTPMEDGKFAMKILYAADFSEAEEKIVKNTIDGMKSQYAGLSAKYLRSMTLDDAYSTLSEKIQTTKQLHDLITPKTPSEAK